MELLLRITGTMLILLAFIHCFFPRYFQWKKEFTTVSLVNRQMMYIHCLFIAVVLVLLGVLCLSSPLELLNTPLGKRISLGIAVFWMLRLFVQFFGYSAKLWRGKAFETTMHIVFSALWIFLSTVFTLAFTY